ncbi:restriction endonuclease subunit S [Streptomyces canus]
MSVDGERGLPAGWAWVRLDHVCDVSGGIQKQGKRRPVKNKFPFLRVANVGRGSLALGDVHQVELFEGELDRFRLQVGDLLVVEGNGSPDQIGRAAMWRGAIKDAVHQNHLIKVRPTSAIDPQFLELLWNSPNISAQLMRVAQSSSGLYTLSTSKLNRVEFALPPLAEQQRIVEALEEQLSRLDAAAASAAQALRRVGRLKTASLASELVGVSQRARLKDVLASPLINGRSVKTMEGGFPVLRLTAIKEGITDLGEFKAGAWSAEDARPFVVTKGDFLIARGNGSLKLVGKGGLVGEVRSPVAFPDTMIRVRPDVGAVLPQYLSLVWGSPEVRKQIESRARTTAGIYKVNQRMLEAIEFPLPSIERQQEIVDRQESNESALKVARTACRNALRRGDSLKRALLRKAFEGGVVPQDSFDTSAADLLVRVVAERAAQPKAKRTRRTTAKKAAVPRAATPADPAPQPTPAPALAVQQEFDL